MSIVIPFRLPEPLAIVSINGANWQITMFRHDDSAPLGVLEFAIADHLVPYLVDMHIECWRLVFGDGASGIRDQVGEAVRLEALR